MRLDSPTPKTVREFLPLSRPPKRPAARVFPHLTRHAKRAEPQVAISARNMASARPVAVRLDDVTLGLALKTGDGFLFFSGSHHSDPLDRKIFSSLDRIREAARALMTRAMAVSKP